MVDGSGESTWRSVGSTAPSCTSRSSCSWRGSNRSGRRRRDPGWHGPCVLAGPRLRASRPADRGGGSAAHRPFHGDCRGPGRDPRGSRDPGDPSRPSRCWACWTTDRDCGRRSPLASCRLPRSPSGKHRQRGSLGGLPLDRNGPPGRGYRAALARGLAVLTKPQSQLDPIPTGTAWINTSERKERVETPTCLSVGKRGSAPCARRGRLVLFGRP
jgi:hypothetical protein